MFFDLNEHPFVADIWSEHLVTRLDPLLHGILCDQQISVHIIRIANNPEALLLLMHIFSAMHWLLGGRFTLPSKPGMWFAK